MGCWRRFHNDQVLMNEILNMDIYDQQTQSVTVAQSDKAGEGHEDDEEANEEGKYKLFKDMSSKAV